MCSNRNNNRRHHISYYVADVNGQRVDRRNISDPALRNQGIPALATRPADNTTTSSDANTAGQDSTLSTSPSASLTVSSESTTSNTSTSTSTTSRPATTSRAHHRVIAPGHQQWTAALLARLIRPDDEGLAAAKALRVKNAPKQIFSLASLNARCRQFGGLPASHELVRRNAYNHSFFMTTIDLRDWPDRELDGNVIRRGAIYEDAELAKQVVKVEVQIYVETFDSSERAIEQLQDIVELCENVRELRFEIVGDNDLEVAEEVLEEVVEQWAGFTSGEIVVGWCASQYDATV